jgi:type I restriction enzyme S subunit
MKWQTTPLGEVASLERRSLLPEEIESGTNYLGLEHIESGGRILAYQKVEPGELQSNKFIFDTGTLLYGKLRPYLAKVCIPDREGCCSTDILPIRPSEKLDIGYLKHLLLCKPYLGLAEFRFRPLGRANGHDRSMHRQQGVISVLLLEAV